MADATFVLIPGAGGDAWYWHLVAPGFRSEATTPWRSHYRRATIRRVGPTCRTRVSVGRDDRLFPADFQRRIARERLGIDADEIPGGDLVALSRPAELVDSLEAYRLGPIGGIGGADVSR